jgi:hypothetical protein
VLLVAIEKVLMLPKLLNNALKTSQSLDGWPGFGKVGQAETAVHKK